MDNLTHSLTGLLMSRAGLDRLSPRATAILITAANIPDLDAVSWFSGPLAYLHYHRGWTHALPVTPLLAVLPVLLVSLFARQRLPWFGAWILSLLGVLSHIGLDWTNAYAVRLLLPFSERWLHLDSVFIIDIWLWALFAISLAGPALSRLVSSEIGAKPGKGRSMALFILAVILSYEYARYTLHARAVAVLEARLHEGAAPVSVHAIPNATNPLRWMGVVEGQSTFAIHDLNLLTEFDPAEGQIFYKAPVEGPVEIAARTDAFRQFLEFSQLPLWRSLPADRPEGAVRVEVVDLRFGAPPDAAFWISAVVDRSGKVLETSVQVGRSGAREVHE